MTISEMIPVKVSFDILNNLICVNYSVKTDSGSYANTLTPNTAILSFL